MPLKNSHALVNLPDLPALASIYSIFPRASPRPRGNLLPSGDRAGRFPNDEAGDDLYPLVHKLFLELPEQ